MEQAFINNTLMKILDAFLLAEKNGYKNTKIGVGTISNWYKEYNVLEWHQYEAYLDNDFWICLGKGLGWKDDEWKKQFHIFVDSIIIYSEFNKPYEYPGTFMYFKNL